MTADTIRDAATGLIALNAGFLGVVITLVALLPALTEAALKGTTSEYERAVRGTAIQHDFYGFVCRSRCSRSGWSRAPYLGS